MRSKTGKQRRGLGQAQRRNPRVYARGRARHPDHPTITLSDWHRVAINAETETDTMRNVAFID